ncbi:MAG: tripartite tricarboxylate transporter substrate binding protein [Planctomycetota bacterium]|jgi:tripartite-type tricarboxylate transporter receptor subunit TctC|nr:tripartite tricarboxylate transporter substrate binding protein [Planctomycetota bacterium]
MRNRIAMFFVSALLLAAAASAGETAWPVKAVEIIVPFSAGGDTDINGRLLAKYLPKELGQSVVVTNIAGGGSSVGMDEVHNSNPDGYRFLANHAPIHTTKAFGISEYGYEGFDPVCVFGLGTGEVLVVRADFPANNVKELIALSKKNPGQYKFGYNTGATTHYAAVRLKLAGADLNYVTSGSSSERTVGLKGGHLDVILNAIPTVKDFVEIGEFKILANTATKRYPTYPEIPICLEEGVDVAYDISYTLFAVKGTDPAIISKLSEAVRKIILENPAYAVEIKQAYNQQPYYLNTADTNALLARQQAEYMAVSEELQQGF